MTTMQQERSLDIFKSQAHTIVSKSATNQSSTAAETLCEIEHLEELLYQLCDYQDKFRDSNMSALQKSLSSAIAETIAQTEEKFALLKTKAS